MWQVTQVGEAFPDSMCENGFTHGVLVCNKGLHLFRMSSRTLRFMLLYQIGYMLDGPGEMKEGENTPSVMYENKGKNLKHGELLRLAVQKKVRS